MRRPPMEAADLASPVTERGGDRLPVLLGRGDAGRGAFPGDLRNRTGCRRMIWWAKAWLDSDHPLCVVARRVWTTHRVGYCGSAQRVSGGVSCRSADAAAPVALRVFTRRFINSKDWR